MHKCKDKQEGCEHKNLEFCPHCRVVFCKDCGKEWYDNMMYNIAPSVWPNWSYTTEEAPQLCNHFHTTFDQGEEQ